VISRKPIGSHRKRAIGRKSRRNKALGGPFARSGHTPGHPIAPKPKRRIARRVVSPEVVKNAAGRRSDTLAQRSAAFALHGKTIAAVAGARLAIGAAAIAAVPPSSTPPPAIARLRVYPAGSVTVAELDGLTAIAQLPIGELAR